MSLVAGSGYTLYYLDKSTGEHVSVPLTGVKLHGLEDTRAVVIYDEVGTYSPEDVEGALTPGLVEDRRVAYLDHGAERRSQLLELSRPMELTLDLVDFDERALRRAFYPPDVQPFERLERRRPDWRDRGPQHKNRKKRSWRR